MKAIHKENMMIVEVISTKKRMFTGKVIIPDNKNAWNKNEVCNFFNKREFYLCIEWMDIMKLKRLFDLL
jgi:hypothetical protein